MKARLVVAWIAWLCLFLGLALPAVAKPNGHSNRVTTVDAKFAALSPLGTPPPIQQLAMAPRPSSLDGKTIYVVDDGFPGGEVLLNEMVAWFNRNMPKTTVLFRRKAGPFEAEDPALFAEIKAKGDAVIMGMGH